MDSSKMNSPITCPKITYRLVIKYAGTIRKGFALIFGILISGIVQSLIDENKSLSKEDISGGLLAALSLYMHASFPYFPKTKAKAE